MTRKFPVFRSVLILVALCASMLFAQERPADNIDARRHPNLAEAQKLCNRAYDKLVEAQGANDFDMEGHAAKAKELLVQASHEMKEAALAANKH